ncbi:hypothetical protein ACN6MY_11925 [Peribacillus sp. B-H-3]|uniref:hypothetical protein n=1 Tax=Peribacillus sp. B-H-3 TaxID=3400420 RepID=UPI003B02E67A
MIIKGTNEEETFIAKRNHDLLEASDLEIIYVGPYGVRQIYISKDREGTFGFSVNSMDNHKC